MQSAKGLLPALGIHVPFNLLQLRALPSKKEKQRIQKHCWNVMNEDDESASSLCRKDPTEDILPQEEFTHQFSSKCLFGPTSAGCRENRRGSQQSLTQDWFLQKEECPPRSGGLSISQLSTETCSIFKGIFLRLLLTRWLSPSPNSASSNRFEGVLLVRVNCEHLLYNPNHPSFLLEILSQLSRPLGESFLEVNIKDIKACFPSKCHCGTFVLYLATKFCSSKPHSQF